ncbi:MAG: hypothetical protein ACRC4G_04480 [Alphaproteobacteria bacterium]
MNYSNYHDAHIEKQIAQLLLEDWDPIGIKNIPEAKNEYDDYAGDLCKILAKEKNPEQRLLDYLTWLETVHMGLPHNLESIEKIIKKILCIIKKDRA